MKRRITGPWVIPAITLLLFALLTAISETVVFRERQHLRELQYRQIYEHAGMVRTQLETEINTTLNLSLGLVAFITANPDFPCDTFDNVAQSIMGKARHIRNIALAKANVITHMFPKTDNESAIGLRYADNPAQWPAVKQAMESRKTVVAGPVNLIQGGRAFISRIPIYTQNNRYWGLASVAINEESLYRFSGLVAPTPHVRYALKGKDGLGSRGEVFHGDPALFSDPDAIILPVTLPQGEWILAAAPENGWIQFTPNLTFLRWAGLCIALIIASLVYALLQSYRRIREIALRDHLTGLANRHLFEELMNQLIRQSQRKNKRFTLLYIDLNRFKPVNDRFGHKTGDLVLTTIASRLCEALRGSDIISRVGGDEFILLLPGMSTRAQAEAMASKLTRTIEEPIALTCGQSITVGASIGISIYPDNGITDDALISHADHAMYQNKRG